MFSMKINEILWFFRYLKRVGYRTLQKFCKIPEYRIHILPLIPENCKPLPPLYLKWIAFFSCVEYDLLGSHLPSETPLQRGLVESRAIGNFHHWNPPSGIRLEHSINRSMSIYVLELLLQRVSIESYKYYRYTMSQVHLQVDSFIYMN